MSFTEESFTEDELNIVLATIYRLAALANYNKAISSEVLKETNIENVKLSKILKYSIDQRYLQECAHAQVRMNKQGGTVGLALTKDGISYVRNLNN